jgi:ribonuclease HI
MPFYAVQSGRKPGVYKSWKECLEQVKGYKGCVYKKFDNSYDAKEFVNDIQQNGIKQNGNHQNDSKKFSINDKEVNYIYTDGSCVNNGKENAIAGIGIYFPNDKHPSISQTLDKNIYKQTNNTAELLAIITALEIVKAKFSNEYFIIFTDSKYSMLCAGTYGDRMNKKNWSEDIKNKELVKKLYTLYNLSENVKLQHIFSHTGNQDEHSLGNEQADHLAYNALNSS